MEHTRNIESGLKEDILRSLGALERWVEEHGYQGYEPFDGLSSPVRVLTFGNLMLDRILMQAVRRSPVNLRPLLGIRPLDSTIGRGYMAWGYLIMLETTGRQEYARKARACLDWLIENRSPGFEEYAWGKHFDFASRAGRYPKFEPITIWTALIGMAFLEAYERLGEKRYLEAADSSCRWFMGLSRNETGSGACLSYTASGEGGSTIHNHSMVAAAMLARTASHTGEKHYLDVAKSAMEYSCSRQLPEGAWWYGEEPKYHWIDNFHTGYNLDSLRIYTERSGDGSFRDSMMRGLEFYMRNFFEDGVIPRYYHDRLWPVDSQCVSQSIDTLAGFGRTEPAALDLARKVAAWAMENMQDGKGFFYYRRYPGITVKTPMLHWAQATMYKALAELSRGREERS